MEDGGAVDAATHPAVIWTVVVTACVSAVFLAAARVLPPMTDALSRMRERSRVARQKTEDARIKDLSEQVDHLAGRVWSLEQSRVRQDAALMAHAVWDQQLIALAIEAGITVPTPPPLYPPPDP